MTKKRRVRGVKIQLNPAQQEAVDHNEGALIVASGPGSGKTRVVVERIARMVKDNTVRPEHILATTFTRKAADEMNSRLESKNVTRASVRTMHSYCWSLIREHNDFHGWRLDEKEISNIVLSNILGHKEMNWVDADKSIVKHFISTCRNQLVPPEESESMLIGEFADRRYAIAYFKYHEALTERKLVTFDDMLYHGVRLLRYDPKLLNREQGRYRYVIVDEFQDSNTAQIELADLVASPEYNLMVVGDTDQALYSWRGAVPEFMLEFKTKYDAKLIELDINYRCAPKIVEASLKCISNNVKRIPIKPKANRTNEVKINFNYAQSTDDEARYVRQSIQQLHEDGLNHGNIFVLMRTNAQSRAIEEEFIKHKIPFIVLGAVSFYERKEIKHLLSYLRILLDPRDIKSGNIMITKPFKFTGKKIIEEIAHLTPKYGSYIKAAISIQNKLHNEIKDRLAMLDNFDVKNEPPAKILKEVMVRTNYVEYIISEDGSDTVESNRPQNISELISSSSRFNTVMEFLKYVDLQIKLRKRNRIKKVESRVQVMSIHKSKGLEIPAVFIIGANEGILPHYKAEIEEERRLFYVAMTRAKDHLHVSAVEGLTDAGTQDKSTPSRFAYEAEIVPDKFCLTTDGELSIVSGSNGVTNESSKV